MFRFSSLLILCILAATHGSAQKSGKDIPDENRALLRTYEDSLVIKGDSMIYSTTWETREYACVSFIRTLVRALQVEGSYAYPFDSLRTVSILHAPDGRFRIFTWQLTMDDQTYRYYGTIQMQSQTLKMYPLIDMSMFIGHPEDTVLDNNNWYGCLYFNISEKKYRKHTYYMLYGWDGNDSFSNKKIVDVLQFDSGGDPVFGAPIFTEKDSDSTKTRVIIEYKEDATANLNYDPKQKRIVISFLVPENPLSEGIGMTYVPDGTYWGYKFHKGMWQYQDKIFHKTIKSPPENSPKRSGEDPNIYIKNSD